MMRNQFQHMVRFYFSRGVVVKNPTISMIQDLKKENYHIKQKPINQQRDINKIIEQMYYSDEAKAQVGSSLKDDLTFQESQDQINNLQYRQIQEDTIRSNQTAHDLLEYYKNNQEIFLEDPQYFPKLLSQMSYCFNYEESIRKYKEEKIKQNQNKLRQLKQGITIQPPIFYTQRQVWENRNFEHLLVSICNIKEVGIKLECRKILFSIFKRVSFNLDYNLYQQCSSTSQEGQNYDNQNDIYLLQILSLVNNSMTKNHYHQQEINQFQSASSNKQDTNFFRKNTKEIIHQIYDRIDYSNLSQSQLVFLATYKKQTSLLLYLKPMQYKIQYLLLNSLNSFTLRQCIDILDSFLQTRQGSKQFYEAFYWNLLRFQIQVQYYEQFEQLGKDTKSLSKVLTNFQDFQLQIVNNQQSHNDIRFDFGLGFLDIYSRLILQLENVTLDLQTAENFVKIAKLNFIQPDKIQLLTVRLIKDKIKLQPTELYSLTSLGAISSAMYEYTLFVIQNFQFQMEQSQIKGVLESNVDAGVKRIKNKRTLEYYGLQKCQEIEQQICALWSVLCQNLNLNKNQILDYTMLNEYIHRLNKTIVQINEPGFANQDLIVRREILSLANQINAYINLFGRKQFPTLINIEQIYGAKLSKIISLETQKYPKPLRLEHKIFLLEKKCFCKKYQDFIKKDQQNNGFYYDWFVTNEDKSKSAYVIVHEPQQYNTDISIKAENYTLDENHSIKFLRAVSKGHVFVEIGYKDIFEQTQEDGLLLFERKLKGVLPQVQLNEEQIKYLTKNLRQLTLMKGKLLKSQSQSQTIAPDVLQEKNSDEDSEIDEYELSDQD